MNINKFNQSETTATIYRPVVPERKRKYRIVFDCGRYHIEEKIMFGLLWRCVWTTSSLESAHRYIQEMSTTYYYDENGDQIT